MMTRKYTLASWWRPGWTAALLLWFGFVFQAAGAVYEARVVKIMDGVTIETLDSARHTERVRISGIDAPERKQAYGTQARQRLADLVGGREVTVYWDKRDRYGRTVGKITVDGRDVGLTMIRDGFAWWYWKYADEQNPADRMLYETAELAARKAKRGLWSERDPMAPWDYRH